MVGYLTPSALPTDTICRILFIPNNEEFLANVTGALQLLTFPDNWTKYGTLTPEQAADALVNMFDRFCFAEGECKMIGEIILWSGSTNPDPFHWLLCDGTSLSNVSYPDLYAIIGITYGGTGPTNFQLPDMRGRTVIGETATHLLGSIGGQEEVTLTTAEMPRHSHTDIGHAHGESGAIPNATTIGPGLPEPTALPSPSVTASGIANLTNTGGDGAHENMQPYLTLNYYIVVL